MFEDKFAVVYKGEKVTYLNPMLVKRQNLNHEAVERIKALHVQRLSIEDDFQNHKISAQEYREGWTQLQFELQTAWGFPHNQNFHRFWDMPGCKCPKIDNNDAWPTGHYIVSQSCPVHGKETDL